MNTVVTGRLVNGVRLHCEERGERCDRSSASTACGSTGDSSGTTLPRTLAGLGRVISYDRRGCGRSEPSRAVRAHQRHRARRGRRGAASMSWTRPPRSSSAAAWAERWRRSSRFAIPTWSGRSSCWSPTRRASSRPQRPQWVDGLRHRLGAIAERSGIDAVGEALITEVADADAWRSFPAEIRETISRKRPGDPRRASGRMVASGGRVGNRGNRAADADRGRQHIARLVPRIGQVDDTPAAERPPRHRPRRSSDRSGRPGRAGVHRGGAGMRALAGFLAVWVMPRPGNGLSRERR